MLFAGGGFVLWGEIRGEFLRGKIWWNAQRGLEFWRWHYRVPASGILAFWDLSLKMDLVMILELFPHFYAAASHDFHEKRGIGLGHTLW